MSGILRSALLIFRGLFRNPRHWGGVIAITLLITSLSILYLITSATRLTPTQLTEAYIGNATYQVTSPADRCPPGECAINTEIVETLESMGATNILPASVASGASLANDESTRPRVDITETEWANSFHPEAYKLIEGRWPTTSTEIAVTADSELGLTVGSEAKFYDHTPATVVGVVEVTYVPSPTSLLAGPGMIDRIYNDLQKYGNRYAGPDVQANVRWDGPDLDTTLPEIASVVSENQSLSKDVALGSLERSASERDDSPRPPWDWFLATPSLWGSLPVVVISLMAGVIAVLSNRDFARRVVHQLMSIGIGHVMSVGIVTAFRMVLLAASTFTGMTLGWFLTLMLRPQLEGSVGHILSPIFVPWFFTLVLLILTTAIPGSLAAAQIATPHLMRGATWFSTAQGRGVLATLTFLTTAGGTIWTLRGIRHAGDNYNEMTQFVVGLGILGAVLIAALLTLILRRDPRHLMTALPFRRMRGNRILSTLVALLSSIAVVIPLSLGISLTTTSFYGAQRSVGLVPEGSVELGMSAANVGGVPPGLSKEVADYAGLPQPALVRASGIMTNRGDGAALVVDSQSEVEQLLSRRLSEEESRVWSEGGLLTSSDLYDGHDHVTLEAYTNDENSEHFDVPVTRLTSLPPEYSEHLGFIPLSTAHDHNAFMLPTYYVFSGVSRDQSDATARSPQALDFDPSWVHVYEAPTTAAPSPSVSTLAAALAATLLLVVIALARTVSRQLRPYGASLAALGIGPGVLAATLTMTLGYLVVLPLILGAAAAIAANSLGWSLLADGYAIIIPWQWVLLYSGTIFLVIIAAVVTFGVRIARVQRRDTE